MLLTNGIFWQDGPCREEERYDGYLQLENGVGMLTTSGYGGTDWLSQSTHGR